MPYGVTPQAIGQMLVQYQPPNLKLPQVQPSNMGRTLMQQGMKDLADSFQNQGKGRNQYQFPLATAPGISPMGNYAAQAAVNTYGPVIMDPNNPYAGSQ